MKKLTAILTAALLLVTLGGCAANVPKQNTAQDNNTQNSEPEVITNSDTDTNSGGKALVAYFSCTGTTKGAAEVIADSIGADLYRIEPAEPYTDDDLNYSNNSSRTSIEMNDETARPEIAVPIDDMEQYDVVFIGYPIWWGEAPRIISTFVESYDFSGKTLVPFCTSGSSGIGNSAKNLEKLTDGATWLDGARFSGSNDSRISDWLDSLDLDVKVN